MREKNTQGLENNGETELPQDSPRPSILPYEATSSTFGSRTVDNRDFRNAVVGLTPLHRSRFNRGMAQSQSADSIRPTQHRSPASTPRDSTMPLPRIQVLSTGNCSADRGVPRPLATKFYRRFPLLLAGALAWCSGMILPGVVSADHLELVVGESASGNGRVDAQPQPRLNAPFGIDFDRQGHMYIVELEGGHIHRWTKRGGLVTVAGNGKKGDGGDRGPAVQAIFHSMHALAIDPEGTLYIADTLNHRVRRMDPVREVVEPFAGTGAKGSAGTDGPALSANFDGVYCVALTPDYKRLLITDLENHRVCAVDLETGRLRLVAGNGKAGVPSDGAMARESPLVDPRAAAADRFGNIYILERGGHTLRKVDPQGRIRTVVGTGTAGVGAEEGPAREMPLRGPKHLCIAVDGRVVIADTDNHQIRCYDPETERLRLVAGSGKLGAQGLGGPAKLAELHFPHGVCLDSSGELFIVDTGNNRILRLVQERALDLR